jgi:hypothetical protein
MRRLRGVEQRRYQQGRCYNGEGGPLASEDFEDPLQHNDTPEVNRYEHRREGAVDQGAINDDVYVVEPVAQDGDPYRRVEGNDGHRLKKGIPPAGQI